jgi:hypothetical protein
MNLSNRQTVLLLGSDSELSARLESLMPGINAHLFVPADWSQYDPFSTWTDVAVIGPRVNVEERGKRIRALKDLRAGLKVCNGSMVQILN